MSADAAPETMLAETMLAETMLAEMAACAHRLGMAFAREAERMEDWRRKIELVELFNRCFFGMRVAIALQMRLRRSAGAPVARRDDDREVADSHERDDPPETEGRLRLDADRDRDVERASLPLLLNTLRSVAADAAALSGPPPEALQPLTALLARATRAEAPAIRRSSGLRNRLAGPSPLPMATPPPRPGLVAHSFAAKSKRLRAATGPPGR